MLVGTKGCHEGAYAAIKSEGIGLWAGCGEASRTVSGRLIGHCETQKTPHGGGVRSAAGDQAASSDRS